MSQSASSKDVAEIVGGIRFREFMDDSFGVVRDIHRLVGRLSQNNGSSLGREGCLGEQE